MSVITNVQDMRRLAKRRIPKAIFDYADRGSYDEITLAANSNDLKAINLRQRVMVDVSNRTTETTLLGEKAAMPLMIAPTGLTGLFHGNGEILGCRAAQAFGIPFTLSTMSICSIEDVAEANRKPFWFQLYVMRDRAFSKSLIERAIAAKCSALVLTLDLQIQGQRHNDIKNGLAVPPKLTLANAIDIATKPSWALSVLMGKRKTFGNLAMSSGAGSLNTLSHWIAGQFDPSLSWKDVEWVRSIWPGKLILKGVVDIEDARIAAGTGADAVIVSNHGGRQLDGGGLVDLRASCHCRGDRRQDRSLLRWRHPERAGHHEGGGAWSARLPHRQGFSLWARRNGRGWRRQDTRYPSQGARRQHGADRHEIDRRDRSLSASP